MWMEIRSQIMVKLNMPLMGNSLVDANDTCLKCCSQWKLYWKSSLKQKWSCRSSWIPTSESELIPRASSIPADERGDSTWTFRSAGPLPTVKSIAQVFPAKALTVTVISHTYPITNPFSINSTSWHSNPLCSNWKMRRSILFLQKLSER